MPASRQHNAGRGVRNLLLVLSALVISISSRLLVQLYEDESSVAYEAEAILPEVLATGRSRFSIADVSETGSATFQNQQLITQNDDNDSATLALLDPRFTGGFRNQHMRLTGLVLFAVNHNISNLLLDSLRYDNKVVSRVNSTLGRIPFEELFDVKHWNQISDRVGTHVLPRLVRYSPTLHSEWDPNKALFRALDSDSVLKARFRQEDMYPLLQNCSRPYAFGSGRKVGQRTWGVYMQHRKKYGNRLSATDLALIEALQPCETLAKTVESITHSIDNSIDGEKNSSEGGMGNLLAIHPRTELDMLKHKCSKHMTRNLTKIFNMIEESDFFSDFSEADKRTSRYQKVFLCISRSGMQEKTGAYQKYRVLMDQNLLALNRAGEQGLWHGTVEVKEGGEPLASSLGIPMDMVQTAAQVMDFFVAVRAKAFVGTFGSSYSTDVWTARYFLAKQGGGDPLNYFHGPDGIGLIGGGGLPPVHHC